MPKPAFYQRPEGVEAGQFVLAATYTDDDATEGGGIHLEIDIRGFIGDWWDGLDTETIIRRVRDAAPTHVKLNISSPGGFVADALAIHDFLAQYDCRVEARIEGLTASSATVIAMCADRVLMSQNAAFLVHHPWFFTAGNHKQLLKDARQLEKLDTILNAIYQRQTGKSRDAVDALMEEETWLTATETLEWGFIDEVYDPKEAISATAFAQARAMGLPEAPATCKNCMPPKKPDDASGSDQSYFEAVNSRLLALNKKWTHA